tara:strand:+ start:58 stop:420 length:363 start_codon:yes stop_codon:yes gene_type:complete
MAKSKSKFLQDVVSSIGFAANKIPNMDVSEVFGEGTYASRAEEALPGILERIQMQEMARLQNVPTLGLLPTMQGGQVGGMGQMGRMAMPQAGLLQSLATQGMGQISQGQTMNPTILKAKV